MKQVKIAPIFNEIETHVDKESKSMQEKVLNQ